MADPTPGNPSNPPWGPSIPAAPQSPPRCDGEGKTGVRAEGDGGRDESRPDDTGISTGAIDQPPGAARIPAPPLSESTGAGASRARARALVAVREALTFAAVLAAISGVALAFLW